MSRCSAVSKRNDQQCNNFAIPQSVFCQTHGVMIPAPKQISATDYNPTTEGASSSRLGGTVSVNLSHRRLIGRAKNRYLLDPVGAGQLAKEFGGDANWWSRIIVYGSEPTPKYLQSHNVALLKKYLAAPVPEPEPILVLGPEPIPVPVPMPETEPLGVMDDIGVAREVDPLREPEDLSLKDLHDQWLKDRTPEEVKPSLEWRMDEMEDILAEILKHLIAQV